MTTPTRGQFTLHARAQAPLKAGDYVLAGRQELTGGDVAPFDGHLRVSSPRYVMPPDQILSTFPPANAEGSFEERLPQIVLKRRTLPWDRRPGAGEPDEMPWLALVVIAEGEGQLSGEVPVAECVTPGEVLVGEVDSPTSCYLAVSQTVVNAVFPTKQDVPLLAHVRQVDPSDTELSLGDDDGFLAVVMANRLPQYHRSTGPDDGDRPVRYLACLINLEQQLDVLPQPAPTHDRFVLTADVAVMNLATMAVTTDPDHYVMGGQAAFDTPVLGAIRAVEGGGASALTEGAQLDDADPQRAAAPMSEAAASAAARPLSASATSKTASAADWQAVPKQVAEVAVSASATEVGRLVRDTMKLNFRYDVERIVKDEPTYRFPVLAHWSFTATDAGSFETLMAGLNVGLLGTAPPPTPDPPAGAPPETGSTRPAAELTDTGHVGLPHQTRRGEARRAWYRGPLTPRPAGVDPDHPEVRLPLAHSSDQLRRVTPDGREDLSLAGAFEIGRLLALAQPSIVSARLRWRKEQFGAARAKAFVQAAMKGMEKFGLSIGKSDQASGLGWLLGRGIVEAAAADPAGVLAPTRPLADGGRRIEVDGDLDEVVARGFGIDLDAVRRTTDGVGLLAALHETAAPVISDDRVPFDDEAAAKLRQGLATTVGRLADQAVGGRRDPGPVGPRPDGHLPDVHPPHGPVRDGDRATDRPEADVQTGPDRLDELISQAVQDVQRRTGERPDGGDDQ